MDIRRRNQLVIIGQTFAAIVLLLVLLLLTWHVDPWWTFRLAVTAAVVIVLAIVTATWRLRDMSSEPIPILPLARNHQEIVAGTLFLLLLLGVFLAFWLGWIG